MSSGSLKNMKGLVQAWIRAVVDSFGDPNPDIETLAMHEKAIVDEAKRLLEVRGVSTEGIETKIRELIEESPESKMTKDEMASMDPNQLLEMYDSAILQGKMEELQKEVDKVIGDPKINDLREEVTAEFIRIARSERVMDKVKEFVQEGMSVSQDPDKWNDDEVMDKLNNLLKDLFSLIADELD